MSQLDIPTSVEEACNFLRTYNRVMRNVDGNHDIVVHANSALTERRNADPEISFVVSMSAESPRKLMELVAHMHLELPEDDRAEVGLPDDLDDAENVEAALQRDAAAFVPTGSEDESFLVEEDEEEDGDLEDEEAEEDEESEGVLAAKPGPRPKLIRQNGDKLPSSISVE